MKKEVYVNRLSSFLPNTPVDNEHIEDFIGFIEGKKSRIKSIVLKRNGIKRRYYALDTDGNVTHRNSEMVVEAIKRLFDGNENIRRVDTLCCATTTPDQLVPSHASMVHGQLKCQPVEIFSFSGVCLTSLQAFRTLHNAIRLGDSRVGVCTASELISPTFRAVNYEVPETELEELARTQYMEFERDFLRFMLSDGAAALLMSDKPNEKGLSLKIEWVRTKSYANETHTCMRMGGELLPNGELKGWKEFGDRVGIGNFLLCQDFKILMNGMKFWVDFIEECIRETGMDPHEVDTVIPHISSAFIGDELRKEMQKRDVPLWENWYTNLTEVGNIGSASIFVALDEYMRTRAQKGERILLLVPESARFSYGAALLEVV